MSRSVKDRPPSIDAGRAARALVLLCWAAYFAWLWIGGDMVRYLGPRTYWVVPFGAAVLGAAGIASLRTLRRSNRAGASVADLLGLAILVIPLVAAVAVPRASLGALAASKKNASGGVAAISSVIPPPPDADRPVRFLEIHYANESADYGRSLGIVEGFEVHLTGFVTHSSAAPRSPFKLTRFYVSCCAADAIPYSVSVAPEGGTNPRDDTWLEIEGTIHQNPDGFVVVPEVMREVPEPQDPYLY